MNPDEVVMDEMTTGYVEKIWAKFDALALRRQEWQNGIEEGFYLGIHQGVMQSRADFLDALLRIQFGDVAEIDAVIRRLVSWDIDDSIAAVSETSTVEELLTAEPASGYPHERRRQGSTRA